MFNFLKNTYNKTELSKDLMLPINSMIKLLFIKNVISLFQQLLKNHWMVITPIDSNVNSL